MSKKNCFAVLMAFLATFIAMQGCSTSPSSTAMPKKALANSPSAYTIETNHYTSDPTPTSEMETEAINTDDTTEYAEPTPEPIIPPGIWTVDDMYGVDSEYSEENTGYNLEFAYQAETGDMKDFSFAEKQFVGQIKNLKPIQSGNFTYYIDTNKYITADYADGCSYRLDFPLYRKDSAGNIKFLNAYGFKFTIIKDYIYVGNHFEDAFNSYETWRVSISNGECFCVGESFVLTVPTTGKFMYFVNEYDYHDMLIYRSDKGMEKVEKLRLVVPDWSEVAKKADYCYTLISIDKVDKNHIYFTLTVQDIDATTRYIGKYKVSLNGSKIQKADNGVYYPPLQ